jgi:hypothetical protein
LDAEISHRVIPGGVSHRNAAIPDSFAERAKGGRSMTRRSVFAFAAAWLLVVPWSAGAQRALSSAERRKIESLIKTVESLKDATFVRNGREYDAATAARFLRGKWKAHESSISSAKDFIQKAASVSSTSGLPYMIRFKGGKEMKSGEYLLAALKKLEKPAP